MSAPGRVLGLDVGNVRIGVALSDPLGIIASPHSVVQSSSPKKDAEAIAQLVEKTEAKQVVVGLPLDMEGKVGPQANKVLEFIAFLKEATPVEIFTQDERYSTAAAQRMLIEADVSRKGRKQVIDKVAAQFILQTYLDRSSRAKQEK